MPRFSLRLPENELDILEKESQRTDRRKTELIRELIRTLPNHSHPPESSRKLTKADVARVVDCMYDFDCVNSSFTKDQVIDGLLHSYDLVED